MKRLITKSALYAAILAVGFAHSGNAQEIDIVDNNAVTDYLFTSVDTGAGVVAVDPTVDPQFSFFDTTNPDNDIAIWALPQYTPQTVNGAEWTSGASATLDWQQGNGPFHYGTVDGIPAAAGTMFQQPPSGQRLSHYFRTPFTTTEDFSVAVIDVLVDDAAVFYLDGQEIWRFNCCNDVPGAPHYNAVADGNTDVNNSTTFPNASETVRTSVVLDLTPLGGSLPAGDHLLAYSVHSYGDFTSSDMGADVRLFTTQEENQWDLSGGGRWQDSASWTVFEPNGADEIANLWNKIGGNSTIYLGTTNGGATVGELNIDTPNKYNIAGFGTMTFESTAANSKLTIVQGDLEFQAAVALSNDVDVDIPSGKIVEFNNDVSLNGFQLIQAGAGTMMFNNLVTGAAPMAAAAGTLGGNGVIDGDLHNDGANVAPGSSAGILTVLGDYVQSSNGSLTVEIGGQDPGTGHDVLVVDGTASLDGTINIELINDYVPSMGDVYQIIQAGNISGGFGVVNADGLWDLSNLAVDGTIRAVPEPTSLVLLILGGMLFLLRRRR